MRDLSPDEFEELGSKMENDSILEGGADGFRELTAECPSSTDPDLVGHLYLAHFGNIVRHIENNHQHHGLAEDAVQEAFKSLQARYQQDKRLPEKPIAFLVTAARQWIIKQRRDVRRQDQMPLDAISSTTLGEVLEKRSPVRQPFDAVASAEINEIAQKAMDELDAQTKNIAELHRSGKTFEEIAALPGMPRLHAVWERYNHAVHHVQAALGKQFSSFITTAEDDVRRWVKSRKSAEQAIELLPPPYDEILKLRLIKKMTFDEVAEAIDSTPERVRRDHQQGLDHFYKMFRMTEDELLETLSREKGSSDV